LRNVKRYIKFQVTFNAESNISLANFLLLVQVQIADITVPVITNHTRNLLSRFPSWTKIYQDSIEKATPQLATPDTVAGTLLNALTGECFNYVDAAISNYELDSFITEANIDQPAWIYVSTPVDPGFIKVRGDGIELGRVSSYQDLLRSSETDYVFYYNYTTFDLYTNKDFTKLYVDQTVVDQIPIQNFNAFDETGLRVGLQRLYLESNENFRSRILDVYINPPDINEEGLKRTLRRELDIWRAYDATPNSKYIGATPEIYEIQNILSSTPYFDDEGNPERRFFDFVEDLNKRHPSNFGYIKWGESYWDYAGLNQEGVSRIPQQSDATPVASPFYQMGIGDFEDARIVLEELDRRTKPYSFKLRAHGYKYDSVSSNNYEPIQLKYDTYVSYMEPYYNHGAATINYDLYVKLAAHGIIPANTVFKANLTDTVKNTFAPTASASPEFIIRNIFNASGLTSSDIRFISNDSAATPYYNVINPSAAQSYVLAQIPISAIQQATVNFVSAKDPSNTSGNYGWISFDGVSLASSTSVRIVKNFSNPTYFDGQLRISSRIYDAIQYRTVQSPKIRNSGEYTIINKPSVSATKSSIVITPKDIIKNFSIPQNATPQFVHIDNVFADMPYTKAPIFDPAKVYGGRSLNRDENEIYFIPSSPNIHLSYVSPPFANPTTYNEYASTSGATYNYYFTETKFPYTSTPTYIIIGSNDGEVYPFKYPNWEEFNSDSIETYNFYISEKGIVHASPNINNDLLDSKNSDVINYYTLERSAFGLQNYASSPSMYFTSVEPIYDTDEVKIWTDYSYVDDEIIVFTDDLEKNVSLNYYDSSTGRYLINKLPVRAKYIYDSTKYISPSIRTGWYFQDEDRFIYAKPKTEIDLNNSEIVLDQIARKGSPIIVNVVDSTGATTNYNQVSFYDEATPSIYSFNNFEYITAKDSSKIYLAYSNFFDAKVVDTYTGLTIVSDYSSASNVIAPITIGATPAFIVGRKYKVTYRVKDCFNVDNQYYNSLDSSYRTKVTLLSTPNSSYTTHITFESSLYDEDYELPEIKLNPLYSALNEGYLYLSHNEYEYATVEYSLSPKQVLADNKDFMVLNVFSLDSNGNPKPYSNFQIAGSQIAATPSVFTTNIDGFARSQVRYTGSNVPFEESKSFVLKEPNNNGSTINYYVKPYYQAVNKVSAEVDKKIVTADGLQNIKIVGKTNSNVYVYWRRARSLYDLFNLSYSNTTTAPGQSGISGRATSDSNGLFTIGDFICQPDATPGYWFVSVETNFDTSGSVPTQTQAGDIVYWFEKYDSSQSTLDEPVLEPRIDFNMRNYYYAATPAFKVNTLTEQPYYNSYAATPSWKLPSWYPIAKYTQYQMGLMGATPYVVEYTNLRPDYEEE